jgi:gluconolactonase
MKFIIKPLAYCFFATSCLFMKAQSSNLIEPDAKLELVSDQFSFTEGPATAANGDVYFTDQPNNRIHLWNAETNEVSVFMDPAGRANGLWMDTQGRLLAAADEKFELWRIDPNGDTEVLAHSFEGLNFNGPNDIWEHPNGTIYFTDPYYQRPWWERTAKELTEEQVYMISPGSSEVLLAAGNFKQPNGIIGTLDGTLLYIADIGDKKTYRFTVTEDGSLTNRELIIPSGSDGMTLDELGNIYITGNGVHIYSPNGSLISHIEIPERWTANVTFGGTDGKTLFITAMDSVYTLRMQVRGMYTQD